MNCVICSGRLVKNATAYGSETAVLKFTIAAKHGYDSKEEKDRVEFIPCVIFNPSDNLGMFLTEKGKGTLVEFQGRIGISKYKKDKETKTNTEVIVNKSTFNLLGKG